jgi:cyclic beta-1,2-glucan synthetase
MARVAFESILGLTLRDGKELSFRPCIPSTWPGFTIAYRVPGERTEYVIRVRRAGADASLARQAGARLTVMDGAIIIPLVRDGGRHEVEIELGPDVGPRYAPHPSAATGAANAPGGRA